MVLIRYARLAVVVVEANVVEDVLELLGIEVAIGERETDLDAAHEDEDDDDDDVNEALSDDISYCSYFHQFGAAS